MAIARSRTFGVMLPVVPQPTYRIPNGSVQPLFGNTHYGLPPTYARMNDVVGNKGKFNPVSHFTLTSHLTGFPPFRNQDDGFVGTPVRDDFSMSMMSGEKLEDLPWLPTLSASVLSDWSIEAFNKFHDQVPVDVSLPNFLYELKDMKGMIPSIDRRSLSKTASNNFLAWEFGVKPFISDIKAIVNLSDSVQKRIKHLLSVQGKTTNLSFDRSITYDSGGDFNRGWDSPYGWNIGSDPNADHIHFKRQSAKTTVHIGGKLTQDLQDLDDAMTQLKALSAAGGFNKPARVIWNAIPYSFVVDWFFHVGKLLDSLTIQPFGGEYSVSNVGYSIKHEATFLVFIKYRYPPWLAVGNDLLGTVVAEGYSRVQGFPVSSVFLTDGNLTPKQLMLGLAMLEQKRR